MSWLHNLIMTGLLTAFVLGVQVGETAAGGGGGPTTLERAAFEEMFRAVVRESMEVKEGEAVVSDFIARPASLLLPAGSFTYRCLDRLKPNRTGRNSVQFAFYAGDVEVGRVRMSGTVRIFATFVSLKKAANRHAVLAAEDVDLVRRDAGLLGGGVLQRIEDAVGKRLKASLAAGDIVYGYHLDALPLVKRGDTVTIIARSGNLKVTAPGEVRNAAASGEAVRVKNLVSRRMISGRVIGPGMVEAAF